MRLQVDTEVSGAHVLAIEWSWENLDDFELVGPGDSPPPRLLIRVTQMDECDAGDTGP